MTEVRQPSVEAATMDWQVRAFGVALGDIDIDLMASPRPVAAANVLATCLDASGRHHDRDVMLAWPISHRLQGLLAVTVATRGDRWVLTVNCTVPACGLPMDLPLSLDAFRRRGDPAVVACSLPDGRVLDLAVPTGADQLAWLETADMDPGAILARLVAPPADVGEMPLDWLVAVESALEQADPLTTLQLETTCPECGNAVSIPLNLEAQCLALLAAVQGRLLDDIHTLATAYHWAEADILAIPPARRRQYLARLERMWS